MASNRSSIVDRDRWFDMLQRWHPRKPREVLMEFIDDLIEAAGPRRVERLNALLVHTDKTTRSAQEKLDKLARWRDAMRSDPWFWPQLVERDRPVLALVKKIVDESPRPLNRFDVERKFRKYRKVPSTGLAQELKELANYGEIDRYKHGFYWRRGTAAAPYESHAQRAYKLVYSTADQRMREADLALALGLSRRDTATVVSQMRKRGLFAAASGNGFVVVSAQSLGILRHGPIFDGRGKVFFAAFRGAYPAHPCAGNPAKTLKISAGLIPPRFWKRLVFTSRFMDFIGTVGSRLPRCTARGARSVEPSTSH
jgi:hypothetical protein